MILEYFLKSSGVLLLFFGLYHLVLKRETFFTGNRFYLLIGLLASILLPFVVIPKYETIIIETTKKVFETSNETATIVQVTEPFWTWQNILLLIYGIGVAFFLLKFLFSLASLLKLIYSAKRSYNDLPYIHIVSDKPITPFSFFWYIIYNKNLYTKEELHVILEHEQAHCKQWHSIDILLAELFCIVFWMNPLSWLYKKDIQQNLEFLADQEATKDTSASLKQYQLTLLKVSGYCYYAALTNNFYNSLIKKRIVMLHKQTSKNENSWKYILIIPLLTAFVFLFNTKVIASEVITPTPTLTTETFGDLLVTITKNTTNKELDAIVTMFASQGIELSYKRVKRNADNEITAISITLKDKKNEAKSEFKTKGDQAIKDIKLGKKNGHLIVASDKAKHKIIDYSYEVHEDHDSDEDHKIIVKSGKGKSNSNVWVHKSDEDHSIKIEKINGEKTIYYNGKKITQEELNELEKKHDLKINHHEDEEDIIIEVQRESSNNFHFDSDDGTRPLFIVDGKEYDADKMDDLSPKSIETISVIKGEAAIKKYGDKGKNGVIEITTKKE